MSAELQNIWSRVQAELESSVGESTYRIWLEPLRARDLAHGRLSIEVSYEACGWVRERFGRVLQACAERVLGHAIAIELLAVSAPTDAPGWGAPEGAPTAPGGRRAQPAARASALPPTTSRSAIGMLGNPKLTFDQFVIGDCNRLAHAAALAVAELPAQAYNPLFICGPPGVGKTHLLSSIASLLLAHDQSLAVRCTTGEAFTNEFLGSLTGQHTGAFKTRYRDVDVLLVDDVQFLERKTRTEEEFFHTFNALYDGGRQLVLTSDRPPRDLQALEDRLRERFACGLVADIDPPDPPTRLAILRKRAQHDRLTLADDSALELIAERITDNVRAIEGALIRVVAFSSLTGRPLDAELAREVLDGLYPASPSAAPARHHPPSLAEIVTATSNRFGLTAEELMSSSRTSRIAWPRQVAMYLARELTGQSLPAIGRHFGGRDHTTVLHACRRTTTRIARDEPSREAVEGLLHTLCADPPPASTTTTDRLT